MGVFATAARQLDAVLVRRRAVAPAAIVRLGSSGPPVASVMPRPSLRRRVVRTLALDADADDIVRIYYAADHGYTWDLFDLFEDARDRDSRLDAVSRARILAIQSCPLVVSPPDGWEDDEEAKEIAENTQIILRESPRFRGEIAHLAHGTLYGVAVSEMLWRRDHRGWRVPTLHWRHGNWFGYLDNTEIAHRDTQHGSSLTPLSDYPDQFVVHSPMGGRSSYPWRRGAIRSRMFASLSKRWGHRFWLGLLERWGQPQVFANIVNDESPAIRDEVLSALEDLAEDWSAVFPEGVRPETIEMSGQVTSDLHAKFVEMQNTEDAIAILGQNLTTEVQSGSFAAAEAHRAVAQGILAADLEELSETLTQQVAEPIVRHNWPGAPVPRIKLVPHRAYRWTLEDVKEGLCTEDEYREDAGKAAKADGTGKEYRRPLSQVPAGFPVLGLPAPSSAPLALPAKTEDTTDEPKTGEVVNIEAAPDQAIIKDPTASLNGAQVASMKEIVADVAAGQLPRDTGIAMIVASFPVSEQQAEKIMGTVGAGFVPKAKDEAATATFAAARAPGHDGVMIAVYPSPELTAELALDGGEPAEELHLTLAFFGSVDEFNERGREDVVAVLETFVAEHDALMGKVGGVGRFAAPDGRDPVYASADVPGLSRLRTALVEALEVAGVAPLADHDFTPHITLAYLEPGSPMPVQSVEPRPFAIDALELVVAGERRRFPLRAAASGGTPPALPFDPTTTTTTTSSTSPTSARSMHPLARALSRR